MASHVVQAEETLLDIARNLNLGFVELRAANPDVDPWVPGAGTRLTIPARHLLPDAPRADVVVNLGEMRLYRFFSDGRPTVTFPIGVGREGMKTPLGATTIVRRAEGPSWRPTPRMRAEDPSLPAVVGPGPDNPLGSHALYLGWPAYLIHGTNKPWGVGRRVSSGCIRLYPEDIARLYEMTPTGTSVHVVDQPIKLAWAEDRLWLEAHPSKSQADQIEMHGEFRFELPEGFSRMVIEHAGEAAGRIDWQAVRRAVKARAGYPVAII